MTAIPPWPATSVGPNTNSNESAPSVSTSDGTNDSETGMDEDGTDAEGVWSADIEQSFQEALAIYPPCGRRKIILSDEGKMYGRNELIARYIKLRTGKTRSRKQVSSHIQVLARRKSKDIHTQLKSCPNAVAKERALQSLSAMSSSQIVSASSMRSPLSGSHMGMVEHLTHNYSHSLPQHSSMSAPLGWIPTSGGPPLNTELPHAAYSGMMLRDVKPPIAAASSDVAAQRAPAWEGRSIAGPKLRLKEFVSFLSLHSADSASNTNRSEPSNHEGLSSKDHIFVQLEATPAYEDPLLEVVDVKQIYDKFPCSKGGLQELFNRGPDGAFFLVKFWADLNINVREDTPGAFYGVNMTYESREQMSISCSTKVCSFGRQVVEKVETDHARYENGRYVYRFNRSQMCDYMVTFIHKLKQLPEKYMMNSVLENFTILQVVQNRDTQETLLCIAFVLEISSLASGCEHSIYRLIKE